MGAPRVDESTHTFKKKNDQQEQVNPRSRGARFRARPSEKKRPCTLFFLRVKFLTREHVRKSSIFVAPTTSKAASCVTVFNVTFRGQGRIRSGRIHRTFGPACRCPCSSSALIAPIPQQQDPIVTNQGHLAASRYFCTLVCHWHRLDFWIPCKWPGRLCVIKT